MVISTALYINFSFLIVCKMIIGSMFLSAGLPSCESFLNYGVLQALIEILYRRPVLLPSYYLEGYGLVTDSIIALGMF